MLCFTEVNMFVFGRSSTLWSRHTSLERTIYVNIWCVIWLLAPVTHNTDVTHIHMKIMAITLLRTPLQAFQYIGDIFLSTFTLTTHCKSRLLAALLNTLSIQTPRFPRTHAHTHTPSKYNIFDEHRAKLEANIQRIPPPLSLHSPGRPLPLAPLCCLSLQGWLSSAWLTARGGVVQSAVCPAPNGWVLAAIGWGECGKECREGFTRTGSTRAVYKYRRGVCRQQKRWVVPHGAAHDPDSNDSSAT